MADHKYIRKYMGKSGKMIYVYRDDLGRETVLGDSSNTSTGISAATAKNTISNSDRRKEKFAKFYQARISEGKAAVEQVQEQSKTKSKSKGGGSSKKSAAQASTAAETTPQQIKDYADKILSGDAKLDSVPEKDRQKVYENLADRVTSGEIEIEEVPSDIVPEVQKVLDSRNKKPQSSANAGQTTTQETQSESSKSSTNADQKDAQKQQTESKESPDFQTEYEPPMLSKAASTATLAKNQAPTTNKNRPTSSPYGSGGSSSTKKADTSIPMSSVKTSSPLVQSAKTWLQKLFGK